jgi:hypothetical protein
LKEIGRHARGWSHEDLLVHEDRASSIEPKLPEEIDDRVASAVTGADHYPKLSEPTLCQRRTGALKLRAENSRDRLEPTINFHRHDRAPAGDRIDVLSETIRFEVEVWEIELAPDLSAPMTPPIENNVPRFGNLRGEQSCIDAGKVMFNAANA